MVDESGGRYLPLELAADILCKLPVKSLIRFTCVCKSWLGLIRKDHQFAIKHYLTRTTSSSKVLDNVDYMLDVERSFKPCLYSFTKAKTFRFVKKFECVPHIKIRASNSCHGIICFNLRLGSEILLCNPSIQEVMLLPPCPSKSCKIALRFDPINNDYKVVVVAYNITVCTMNIYSVRHGHWRNLHVGDSFQCYLTFKGDAASNANGRMCNWLAFKNSDKTTVLVSFDMVEDVLKEFPMPKCLHPRKHEHQLLSSTRWQACLSCFPKSWDFSDGFIDVWVLKGSDKSDQRWSKELVVKCPDHEPMQPLNVWINDNELLVTIEKAGSEGVFYYDLGTQQLKYTQRNGIGCCSRGYAESLVSIKGFMSLRHERKHGADDDKQNDDQDEASKQKDNGEYLFREVSRKGVRWFSSFYLM